MARPGTHPSRRVHRTRRPVRYEKEYLRKDGTRVPIELLVHLSSGDRGQPLYYCFLTDLIARKEAEQALRDSEARFEPWPTPSRSCAGSPTPMAGSSGITSAGTITPALRPNR